MLASGFPKVLALWILSALSSAAPAPGQELRRIYYGTSTSTAHLPIWVAKDSGLFALIAVLPLPKTS